MSPVAQNATRAARRARILRALDIVPWVQRSVATVERSNDRLERGSVPCVVVLPAGCSTRELDLLGRALTAGGGSVARAPRLVVEQGKLPGAVPEALTYLVFGQSQAHALGRTLSAQAMHQAQIVLADEPALILSAADAKRRLWSALRSVRRALKEREH